MRSAQAGRREGSANDECPREPVWQDSTPDAARRPAPLADAPLLQVDGLIAPYYFGAAAAASFCAVLLPLLDDRQPLGLRLALALAFALLGLACTIARRWRGPRLEAAVVGVALGATLLIAATSVAMGWGLNSLVLGFFGLIPCVVCAISRQTLGVAVAVVSLACACALAGFEHAGWIAGATAAAEVPLARRLASLLLLIATGLAAGLLLGRVIGHHMRAGAERERRFAGLLGIAADAYWEMDAEFRVTHLSRRQADGGFTALKASGLAPWEDPGIRIDDDLLDAYRACLENRRAFREVTLEVLRPGAALRLELVSGEPRFDARGVFIGYWGVSRDVTAETRTRESLLATEGRYHELFKRIPSALVLHRGGRVFEANPAALALLGYADLAEIRGHDLVTHYAPGADRAQVRERIAQAEALSPGLGLPVVEGRLQANGGRRVLVRSTAVRVMADGGPATLSIFLDDTERRSAEEAVRRSEALLSHLVATSPDVITLTELESGRYAMVNDTFLALSGYTGEEVIGHSSAELGIWGHAEDRGRLLDALAARPVVRDVPITFVAKSGERFSLLVSAARFEMDGRDYLVINGRDVTDAEIARLEREAILDNASIGIALTRQHCFVLANPRFEQMFGWPAGTLVGQPGEVVWPDPENQQFFCDDVAAALARGEPVEAEYTMRRFDGSEFLCRLQARAVNLSDAARGGTLWIAEDVTERRAVAEALARARDEAEAASRAKSAFLANTSHEIRTPLNGLVGLARLARRPDIDEALRSQYLEQIGESAETLAAIISDILDLSKVEAGKLQLETVAFDLHGLLRTLQRGYAGLAEARGIALDVLIEAGLPQRVRGDPVRVRQILSNYLANALKFTPAGGVRLSAVALAGDRVRFEVHDSGPGIDAETLARLFRPFTQADQSTTRRFGGTGLGLAICRELAALMHGEVGADSTPGLGSRFWAELPLPLAPAEDQLPDREVPDGPGALAGARVLMVEDNAVNMVIGVALLEQWGIRVGQAENGSEAVAAVAHADAAGEPFDAVLMDVQMPLMGGHEAARALRERYSAQALPIVALTAAALVSEREQALAAGMNDFLTKPIDAQRLHSTLLRVLRRS